MTWTESKNARRCDLIDKEIREALKGNERAELERLQNEMLAYRYRMAPLVADTERTM